MSDCSSLMTPLCLKEKDEFSPTLAVSKCGPNTFMDDVDDCHCRSGSYESKPGDAKDSEMGCTDPCQKNPCSGPNTYCQSLSTDAYQCLCKQNFIPIDENIEVNGCKRLGKISRRIKIISSNQITCMFSSLKFVDLLATELKIFVSVFMNILKLMKVTLGLQKDASVSYKVRLIENILEFKFLLDPCDSNPCDINSICQSIDWNDYKCECNEGFSSGINGSCYRNCRLILLKRFGFIMKRRME